MHVWLLASPGVWLLWSMISIRLTFALFHRKAHRRKGNATHFAYYSANMLRLLAASWPSTPPNHQSTAAWCKARHDIASASNPRWPAAALQWAVLASLASGEAGWSPWRASTPISTPEPPCLSCNPRQLGESEQTREQPHICSVHAQPAKQPVWCVLKCSFNCPDVPHLTQCECKQSLAQWQKKRFFPLLWFQHDASNEVTSLWVAANGNDRK